MTRDFQRFVKLSYGLVLMGDGKTRVFPIKGILAPKSSSFAHCRVVGDFGEKEKALNLEDIVAKNRPLEFWIYEFQVGGLICLNMALMLLRRMFLVKELTKESNT